MTPQEEDIFFMKAAIYEAQQAFAADEIPVGAVVMVDGKIVARGHNLTQTLNDATAHAEMQVVTQASAASGGMFLPQAVLYVTLEPCVMCISAITRSKIGRLVYAASDEKAGFSVFENYLKNSSGLSLLHPSLKISSGILSEECSALMKNFFSRRRL